MNYLGTSRAANANEMRELDRRTIEEFNIPGEALMEAAGKGAFEYIMENMPGLGNAVVFCGKGNNGGDGFVIARHMLNAGINVSVYLLGSREKDLKGDARLNLDRFLKLKGKVREITAEDQLKDDLIPRGTDLIVDAIFGTGLDSKVQGLPAKTIDLINRSPAPKLAVDIPSGINASTGQVMGQAVQATATVTFGLAKIGHYSYPGTAYTGELKVVDIGIPVNLQDQIKTYVMNELQVFANLKARKPDSHKGDNGHTLIFAGSPGKTGAAVMAGEAALRAGAGLVTLAVPASLNDIFEIKTTEVMTEPIPDAAARSFDQNSIPAAKTAIQGKDVIAIGPGIGRNKGINEFFREIVLSASAPMVIDADGLNALSSQMEILKKVQAPIILTPHPGEMSRLSGSSVEEIQRDRISIAKRFASEWNVILVLKGARTVTAAPEGEAFINLSGNEGMATAGMGDILTGIIAGLLSQGYEPLDAAGLGVYIHGKAGDLAFEEMGGVGIIATDLLKKIPQVPGWVRQKALEKKE